MHHLIQSSWQLNKVGRGFPQQHRENCKIIQLAWGGGKVQPQAQCLACMYPSLYTWHIQKRTFCTTQSKFFYLRSQALATFKIIFRMNHHTSLAGCDYSWSPSLDICHRSDKDEGSGGPVVKWMGWFNLWKLYTENLTQSMADTENRT